MAKNIIINEDQFKKILKEAEALPHFEERLKNRLDVLDLPQEDISTINKTIAEIRRFEFNEGSYAIRVIKFQPDPSSGAYTRVGNREYYTVIDEKGKDSTGNELWLIVRDNQLHTFFLRKSIQTQNPKFLKNRLNVDDVMYRW